MVMKDERTIQGNRTLESGSSSSGNCGCGSSDNGGSMKCPECGKTMDEHVAIEETPGSKIGAYYVEMRCPSCGHSERLLQ